MKENTSWKYRWLLIVCLCCLFAVVPVNTETVLADSNYPFAKYYDPDEDEWANEERVNMDGQLDFTVPDMGIVSMDIIVYGTAADDPQIETLQDENGKSVSFEEKYSDDSTYTYYTVPEVSSGRWELQLREGSWESTRVYLIYQSSYRAKYTIEPKLDDPDSGKYQALIRLYEKEDQALDLENRSVRYLIDEYFLMSETSKDDNYNCYLGQPGLTEDHMDTIGDDYTCHVVVTAEDGTVVLLQAERADGGEFKEIIKAYRPSLLNRFRARPAEEQKTILLLSGSLLILSVSGIFIVKKTHMLGKRREKIAKAKEERWQNAARRVRNMQERLQTYAGAGSQTEELLEKLEPAEVWLESLYPYRTRKKYERLISAECQEVLKRCLERAEDMLEEWNELRQRRRGISDTREKELQAAIEERGQMITEITDRLLAYAKQLKELENEISRFQTRKMFHDLSVTVTERGNTYSGRIEAMELGMPRRRGLQYLNTVILRGVRKILFDDMDLGGLTLAVGFTQSDSRQELILISNRELFSDDEDMEVLRRDGEHCLGPYQYMQFEGLELYTEKEKHLVFRITSS